MAVAVGMEMGTGLEATVVVGTTGADVGCGT